MELLEGAAGLTHALVDVDVSALGVKEVVIAIQGGNYLVAGILALGLIYAALRALNVFKSLGIYAQDKAHSDLDLEERRKDSIRARLIGWARGAVATTYQEYVRGIKAGSADGTLTAVEKDVAMRRAKNEIVLQAKNEGFDIIKEVGPGVLAAVIEKAVTYMKGGSKKKAVVEEEAALPEAKDGTA